MIAHKYKVGQRVHVIPGNMRMASSGEYKVLSLLPPTEGQNQYRVRSAAEVYDRVVKEIDLAAATVLPGF